MKKKNWLLILIGVVLVLAFINRPHIKNDTKIRYVSFGSGEKTMIIVPGLSTAFVTDNAEGIEQAFDEFTDEYTVYLFDVGEEIPDGYTIETMAEDLLEMIRGLGLKNLYLYGCSMGGMESLYIAGKYPELVEKVVIGSSMAKATETSNAVLGRWVELAKEGKCHELAVLMGQEIYSSAVYEANKDVFVAMGDAMDAGMTKRFINSASTMLDLDIVDYVKAIQCPILVLGSKGDHVLGEDASSTLGELAGGDLYLYDETYPHAVYDEAPDFKGRVKLFFDTGE